MDLIRYTVCFPNVDYVTILKRVFNRKVGYVYAPTCALFLLNNTED